MPCFNRTTGYIMYLFPIILDIQLRHDGSRICRIDYIENDPI
ncbi:MAG: hypothetical protein UZ09_BCD002000059 [Bacteroidetes bacterium OLB9]|nr:MAG: hypothetical protein UZ09_BCD002000059 [Bacteroidetes bacterium OLB9]